MVIKFKILTYHDDMTLRVNSNTLRTEELAVARAFSTQEACRLEVRIDDQQAMIIEIRNNDMTYCSERL